MGTRQSFVATTISFFRSEFAHTTNSRVDAEEIGRIDSLDSGQGA